MTWTVYTRKEKLAAGGLLVGEIGQLRSAGLTWPIPLGTTDAIFLEKPSYYDLLIDLTTSTPNKATRPTFYSSKPLPSQPGNTRAPTHRLSTTRFAWSDVKLVSSFISPKLTLTKQPYFGHLLVERARPYPSTRCGTFFPPGLLRSISPGRCFEIKANHDVDRRVACI